MDFQTPNWCCLKMAELVPPDCKQVLEPTPGEGNLVRALKPKFEVVAPKQFWEVDPVSFYDCVVMNPPFTPMSEGYKIFYRCMNMADHVIALMPWLVLINSERRTEDIVQFGLKKVIHLPRRTFPGSRVQCCILCMDRGFRGSTEIEFAILPSNPV